MHNLVKWATSLAMYAAFSAQAGVIVVSGTAFDDRGATTVDQSTGLEWQDFSATMARASCSVIQDAGGKVPAGCTEFDQLDLIADTDGWRVATRAETSRLLSNWFGFAVGLHGEGDIDRGLATQFLGVFADGSDHVRPNFFPDVADNGAQAVGFFVGDWGQYSMGFYNGDINYGNLGTALVRNAVVDVAEPASLALLGLALPALVIARRNRSRLTGYALPGVAARGAE